MIAYVVEITLDAEREIVEAVQWYAAKSHIAADTFRSIVFDAIEMISHSPLSWTKVSEHGVRKVILPRYLYTVFFHVLGNTVKIISVNHNKRMPRNFSRLRSDEGV